MRKLFIAVFMFVSSFGSNVMADGHAIKMGIILGFTGPIESLTPAMAASAELAFKEASDSGSLLGGKYIKPVRADQEIKTLRNTGTSMIDIAKSNRINYDSLTADLSAITQTINSHYQLCIIYIHSY